MASEIKGKLGKAAGRHLTGQLAQGRCGRRADDFTPRFFFHIWTGEKMARLWMPLLMVVLSISRMMQRPSAEVSVAQLMDENTMVAPTGRMVFMLWMKASWPDACPGVVDGVQLHAGPTTPVRRAVFPNSRRYGIVVGQSSESLHRKFLKFSLLLYDMHTKEPDRKSAGGLSAVHLVLAVVSAALCTGSFRRLDALAGRCDQPRNRFSGTDVKAGAAG